MLGLGAGEMVVVAIIALVVIGPERLPFVMRQAGRWYGQLRRAADDLRRAFTLEADRQDASERYRQLQERRKMAQEERKRAQEQAGGEGAPQPEAVVDGPSEVRTAEIRAAEVRTAEAVDTEPVEVPNDVAPDAPHPDLFHHGHSEAEEAEVVDPPARRIGGDRR